KPLTPDPKGNSSAAQVNRVSLAFAPRPKADTLLAVEIVTGAPKHSVVARVFDLAGNKEKSRQVLAQEAAKAATFGGALPPNWGRAYGYWNSKGEPRVIFDGKLLDAATGKTLQQFNSSYGVIVSRDGKYLVRLIGKEGDKKLRVETWSLDTDI